LLLLIFFSQVGYQLIYSIQERIIQYEQKEKMISLLPDSALEMIADNDQISWEEEGKEFYMNDNLFDVAKIKVINGKKIYFVINDKKETELLKKFNTILRNQQDNKQNKKSNDQGIKYQQPVFIIGNTIENVAYVSQSCSFNIFKETVHPSYISDILIPPPQC
jgi:hypothetical protein